MFIHFVSPLDAETHATRMAWEGGVYFCSQGFIHRFRGSRLLWVIEGAVRAQDLAAVIKDDSKARELVFPAVGLSLSVFPFQKICSRAESMTSNIC